MIHSKKNKILTILLICILLINFIVEPKVANAAVGTATLVALYGPTVAEALLAFILSAAAVGVTFQAVDEAKAMFDKWQMDSKNWQPPVDGGGNGWKNLLKNLIAGGIVAGAGMEMLDKLKNWFQSLGAKAGENNLYDSNVSIDLGSKEIYSITYPSSSLGTYSFITRLGSIQATFTERISNTFYIDVEINTANGTFKQSGAGYRNVPFTFVMSINNGCYLDYNYNKPKIIDNRSIKEEHIIEVPSQATYYVANNSYVITNNPPSTLPQPNIDISKIPSDKLKPIVKPDGTTGYQYEGTTDDLVDDIVESTTEDDVITGGFISPGRYTIYEIDTETGTIIEIVPETGDLPFPDLENPEIPENELVGQGSIIVLLKSIVNWLYNLWLSPQKIIKDLFEVPPNLKLDTSKLRLKDFQLKFPFSIPWDIAKSINVFAKSPTTPDLDIDINAENLKVNHSIDLSRIDLPLRFARYVSVIFFILYLANKTRDLIKW